MPQLTDLNPTALEKRELKEAIAWLRPDPRKRLYPAWGLGVLLLIVGSGCCGIFFHQAIPDSALLLVVGLLSVLLGMLTMVFSAFKVLSDNTCLLWTQKSLIYRDQDNRRTEMLWSEITELIAMEEQQYIEVIWADSQHLKLHLNLMGVSPLKLSQILKEEQRKSLMGIKLRSAEELRAEKVPVSLSPY